MQSSHTFTVDSAVFDERNLVSAAGLVPVLELAEQTGLSELIAEHVQLPSTRVRSGAVNPAGKPWSMPDLSRAIGVSARTLQDGFQRYVGVSPTCYLREVRLQRARADLSNPALCTTVSDTAYPWGFAHLGRLLWPIATSSASRPRRHCQVGIERTSITDAVTLAVPGGRFVTFWACRVDRMAQRLRGGGRPNTRRRQGIRTPRGSRCRRVRRQVLSRFLAPTPTARCVGPARPRARDERSRARTRTLSTTG